MKLPLSASGSWRRGLRPLPGACMPFLAAPLPVDGTPAGEFPFEEPRLEGTALEAEAFLLAVDREDSWLLRFMGGSCPRTVPRSTFPDRGPTGPATVTWPSRPDPTPPAGGAPAGREKQAVSVWILSRALLAVVTPSCRAGHSGGADSPVRVGRGRYCIPATAGRILAESPDTPRLVRFRNRD